MVNAVHRSKVNLRKLVVGFVVLVVLAGTASVVTAAANSKGLFYKDASGAEARLMHATVKGSIEVELRTEGVASVRYYLDDATGLNEPFVSTSTAPFSMTEAGPLDTAKLGDGIHTILAEVTMSGGVVTDFFARFQVLNTVAVPTATTTPAATTPTTSAGPQPLAAPAAAAAPVAATTASKCTKTAADTLGWGQAMYQSDFEGSTLDPTWHPYGPEPGHSKNGVRTPEAITVANGIVTIKGDAQGNTGAMKWFPGQKYGRWEGCLQVSKESGYNALFLLWPDAEDFPIGGEVDWVEIFDDRSKVNWFLHYGASNQQTSASTNIDTTQWNSFALEWTPTTMTAYVNGEVWHTEKDSKIFPPRPMNMCIQLDNFNRGGTASMSVDWTKQWALPESEPSTLGLAPGDPATGQPGDSPNLKPRALTVNQMLGRA